MMIHLGPRAELDDIALIAGQFQAGSVQSCRDLGGTYNLNLLLITTIGSYVVRVYRPWMATTRLIQLQRIKHTLADTGIPVVLPLASYTGKSILHYQGRLVEVEPFIEADKIADRWEHSKAAFTWLGKLHRALATSCTTLPLAHPVVSNYGTPAALLDWTQQLAEKIQRELTDHASQENRCAYTLCREAAQLLSTLQSWWEKTNKDLPSHLTHGDYGEGNLLFRQGQVIAILDFDFLAVRERIYELAYTLYWWLRRQNAADSLAAAPWSKAKALLLAYNAVIPRPLTPEELQLLPLAMARVPLYWIAEANFLPNPVQQVINLENQVTHAQWLLAHQYELSEIFRQAE